MKMPRFQNTRFNFIKNFSKGSSLIEIIIATAVVGGILTAVATALTFSIKSTAEANYRSVATTEAQKAMEVFRRERTLLGWSDFYTAVNGDSYYCFNTLPSAGALAGVSQGRCNTNYSLAVAGVGTNFKRDIEISTGSDLVTVTVIVAWKNPNNLARDHEVEITQEIRRW